jgi:uncharacterized protein (DUF885 family)
MDEYISWDPALATQIGVHTFDHRLRDPTRRGIAHQVERLSEFVSELEQLKVDDLTGDQHIDRDFAAHFFRLRIFEITQLRKHEKGSFAATEFGNSLFFLFSRNHPTIEDRMDSLTKRLESAPKFFEDSREVVTDPFRLWNEILYETGIRMPRFLKELCKHFESKVNDRSSNKRLGKAVDGAIDAIDAHNEWMKKEVIPNSCDKTSIGPELYREYLELQGYGVTPDETLRIADLYLADVNKKKAEVARRIVESGNASDAVKVMRSDHAPDFEGILEEYRSSVLEARRYVEQHGLVTLPEGEKLVVAATPSFMAHVVPYAAQYEPGKFDGDRTGLFLVTPDQGIPGILEEHSHVAIVNTAVHEGYPGHHLHGICSNTNPSSLRILNASPDFSEGWGLYCEEMMLSQGYNDTPMGRLTVLNDLAFRIARQICDVQVSMGRMDMKQATELMIRETGTDAHAAATEANAIALSPTYYMSYFVGKLGVLQMREDAQAALGERFTMKFFHDSLIYSGCMPMPFMRRALALRIHEEFGKELGPPKESVYNYARRALLTKGA